MTGPDLPDVVRERDVPATIEDLDDEGFDYVDVFAARVDSADRVSPEVWARAAMEGAPAAGRFLAWRAALQLDLAPVPSLGHVAGWRIVDRGGDWIRLQTGSWSMTAQIVFRTDPDTVRFATYVRYDRAVARPVWAVVSAIHRAVAPGLLAAGVRRARRQVVEPG